MFIPVCQSCHPNRRVVGYARYNVAVGAREPIRTAGSPGSAWIIELGADYLPCDSIQVDVADAEFARDYAIEADGPPASDRPFARIAAGQWSRRGDEPRRPLAAVFPEQRAARLRLVITDYSNPPLDVSACRVSGAAREVVFSNSPAASGPLRLYYGNLKIEPPHYDLERNLPARLDPPPVRLKPGLPQPNASYIPESKPFSERWPWAIYAVLSLAGIALAAIIASLGRMAVAMDDARQVQEADSHS